MQANTPTLHELAADDVLSVMLNEQDGYGVARNEMGLLPAHMPTPQHRAAYEAIGEIRIANSPVHDTTVMAKCNGLVQLEWINQRFALYDKTRTGNVFKENVKLVMEHGIRAGIKRVLLAGIEQIDAGKKTSTALTSQLMDILSTVQIDSTVKGETAGELGREFAEFMNGEADPLLSTGFDWLDDLAGGFEPGHLWWIAGAYKQRKSTLMLALALNVALQGGNVAILSREMPRRRVAAQMIAMMAVAYLLKRGHYKAVDQYMNDLNNISASSLMRARKAYRKWHPEKARAVDFGIAEWTKIDKCLRTYDTKDGQGSLSDWNSLQRIIRRDKAMYGLDVAFVDYMQLFGAPGNSTYEKTAYLSVNLQKLAIREDVTIVVGAQRSEEAIKGGGKSHSPGVKGGGDAPATADYMLLTSYKQGEDADENKLTVRMHLSRHGMGGGDIENAFDINPSSGLFLESNWIKNIK